MKGLKFKNQISVLQLKAMKIIKIKNENNRIKKICNLIFHELCVIKKLGISAHGLFNEIQMQLVILLIIFS